MIVYVAFGGMKATTWVQIIKACLLLAGATLMSLIVLWRYGFNPEAMFADAVKIHPKGDAIMAPGALVTDPISAISLGMALMFGTAGLPHILMRFFTVSDAKAARKSVFYATGFIAYFYILTFIIGFGAITFLMNDPSYFKVGADGAYNKVTSIIGGTNMAAIHLANATGGSLMLGFISAVAFATILAVVAGLTLAGASAVSHDLYAEVIARGRASEQQEVNISKITAIVIGIVAIVLGYIFENQNVAFMVGLAFAVAASCNFPVLLMSVLWKGTTTRGALIGGLLGLISAVVMVVLSKAVWVQTFGFAKRTLPLRQPGHLLDDRSPSSASGCSRRWTPASAPSRSRLLRRAVHPIGDRASARPAPTSTDCACDRRARPSGSMCRPLALSRLDPCRALTLAIRPSTAWRSQEIEELKAALDIGYFRPGEAIVQRGTPVGLPARHHQGSGRGPGRRHAPGRAWAERQLRLARRSCTARPARISSPPRRRSAISSRSQSSTNLIRRNPAFAAFFYSEVSRKLDAFAGQQRSEGFETRPAGAGAGRPLRRRRLHRRGHDDRRRRAPHARQRHQRPVRPRRRARRRRHRHEPLQGGGPAAASARYPDPGHLPLRRQLGRARTISSSRRCC